MERGEHEEQEERKKLKKVQVITSKGHVLAVYESQKEAARRTGIYNGYISAVCLGKRELANGFIFRPADPKAELKQLSLEELQEGRVVTGERAG